MPQLSTLMAVPAHLDDEATSTGDLLAGYAGEAMGTVMATCANGEFDGSATTEPGWGGREVFVRARPRRGAGVVEDDLFAGLR